MEDYIKAGNEFLKAIDRLNETVPKDKYITAYIIENGEELYITKFKHLGYGVVECELIRETSIPVETSQKNDYCHVHPDKVLLCHISAVRIYFEYVDICSKPLKPKFQIGFQPPTK